jgi:hypothetical protein
LLLCQYFFLSFFYRYLFCCIFSGEEEEEEPEVHGKTLTSTSHTLVLSEGRRAAEETSPPSQQDIENSTPTASPRARTEAGDSHAVVAGGSPTAPLDDVNLLFSLTYYFVLLTYL